MRNQLKDKPKLIAIFLQKNEAENNEPVIHNNYLTTIYHEIIDEDTGVAMEYRNLIKTQSTD